MSHRVIWSSILLLGISFSYSRWQDLFELLLNPKRWLPLLASASFLAFNWGRYIYGVQSDRLWLHLDCISTLFCCFPGK